jgi:hypothetical protein
MARWAEDPTLQIEAFQVSRLQAKAKRLLTWLPTLGKTKREARERNGKRGTPNVTIDSYKDSLVVSSLCRLRPFQMRLGGSFPRIR